MSATIANPEAAAETRDELLKQQRGGFAGVPDAEAVAAAADHAETREHIETDDGPETVTIAVHGETIECRPLGIGERLRPIKQATIAEERGDEMAEVEAVLSMLDTFERVSPDEYDQQFWDELSDAEIRDTFRELGEKSAGGNGR